MRTAPIELDGYYAAWLERLPRRTLCFLVGGGRVLLGRKRRGFGAGKYLGAGGKVEAGESVRAAAARETREELGVCPRDLRQVARLAFLFPYAPDPAAWNQEVSVFTSDSWSGSVAASDELEPALFDFARVPYSEMWPDAVDWLPTVLEGGTVLGRFAYDADFRVYDKRVEPGWRP